jgi:hypothetical protein
MAWEACVRCGELSGAKVISSSVSEMRMSPAVANSSCAGVWADQVGAWLPSFLMRGIAKMRAEWAIVCTAHNLLKLAQESVCGEVDHLASKHRGSLRLPFALILTYWALARPHYQLKVDGLLDSPQEIRCLALRRQSWFDAHCTKPSEGCYCFHPRFRTLQFDHKDFRPLLWRAERAACWWLFLCDREGVPCLT